MTEIEEEIEIEWEIVEEYPEDVSDDISDLPAGYGDIIVDDTLSEIEDEPAVENPAIIYGAIPDVSAEFGDEITDDVESSADEEIIVEEYPEDISEAVSEFGEGFGSVIVDDTLSEIEDEIAVENPAIIYGAVSDVSAEFEGEITDDAESGDTEEIVVEEYPEDISEAVSEFGEGFGSVIVDDVESSADEDEIVVENPETIYEGPSVFVDLDEPIPEDEISDIPDDETFGDITDDYTGEQDVTSANTDTIRQFSGLKPGMMVYMDGSIDAESGECTSQCVPFNPFSIAFAHEKCVWAILMPEKGQEPQGLRPRRVYKNDKCLAIETIEGLCGYPEEVQQGPKQTYSGEVCQHVIYTRTDPYYHEENGHKWTTYTHSWLYEGDSSVETMAIRFSVPIEYILWENGTYENIMPARDTYTRAVTVTLHVEKSESYEETDSQAFYFPERRCRRATMACKSAGRY